MEIKIEKYNIVIPDNCLTAVIDKNIIDKINGKDRIYNIKYNGISLNNNIRKSISYISKDFINEFEKDTIIEYMKYYIYNNSLIINNIEKKICDSLKIAGLNDEYLDRKIKTLSKSEVKLFQLAIALLNNPKVLLLDNFFIYFDFVNTKKIIRLFNKLGEKYHINVILYTKDVDFIYKNIRQVLIIKKNYVTIDLSKNIFEDVNKLKDNKIDIPEIVVLEKKIKDIGVKIDYHRDIRDLIKDIYKHI